MLLKIDCSSAGVELYSVDLSKSTFSHSVSDRALHLFTQLSARTNTYFSATSAVLAVSPIYETYKIHHPHCPQRCSNDDR